MKYLEVNYLIVDKEVFTLREEAGIQKDGIDASVKKFESSKRLIGYQQLDDNDLLVGYVDEKGNEIKFDGVVEMTPTTGEYLTNL